MSSTNDICYICNATADARAGEFLITPGCCGKLYHQSCIEERKKLGENFCQACKTPFPGAAVPQQLQQQLPPQQVQQQLPPQPPQPQAGGFFSRLFGGRSAAPATTPAAAPIPSRQFRPSQTRQNFQSLPSPTGGTEEDDIIPEEADTLKKPAKAAAAPADEENLKVSLTAEYGEESLEEKAPFHVRVSAVFQSTVVDENKTPLDVVCVLDNSGSMSGSKIENLKRAMEFVVSSLGEKDRLSIVTFNSSASTLQGMWKMTAGRKETSRTIVQSIVAGGGTDIYRGMAQGWQVLQARRTKNPASCMFLLTDGQDGSNLEEKKALAKTMREQGTALFIFGFGNDHDAAHLIQISNAAEGSFIYVETNDTVIDAFGGAIGTQQGQLLRDIQVSVAAVAPGVSVQSVLAGSYPSQVSADRRGGQVTLADLYGGEKRDFLLQLSLPAVAAATDSFPLLSVSVRYKVYGSEETREVPAVVASIRRLGREAFLALPSHERDLEVDVQVQRLDYTRAMQEAMREADRNNFARGKEILAQMKKQLLESVSFKAQNAFTLGMLEDLNECERKLSSREAYESGGGRAVMSEYNDMYSKQRSVFSKASRNTKEMQCVSSNVYQERAFASKSKY